MPTPPVPPPADGPRRLVAEPAPLPKPPEPPRVRFARWLARTWAIAGIVVLALLWAPRHIGAAWAPIAAAFAFLGVVAGVWRSMGAPADITLWTMVGPLLDHRAVRVVLAMMFVLLAAVTISTVAVRFEGSDVADAVGIERIERGTGDLAVVDLVLLRPGSSVRTDLVWSPPWGRFLTYRVRGGAADVDVRGIPFWPRTVRFPDDFDPTTVFLLGWPWLAAEPTPVTLSLASLSPSPAEPLGTIAISASPITVSATHAGGRRIGDGDGRRWADTLRARNRPGLTPDEMAAAWLGQHVQMRIHRPLVMSENLEIRATDASGREILARRFTVTGRVTDVHLTKDP